MNEQPEHQDDDVSAHLYIPKDERAGGRSDTEGHMPRARFVGPADEDDVVADAAGDVEGHKRMRGLEDAGEGDVVGDVEGHRVAPSDPINEPSAIRGRDGRGHR